MANYKNIIRSIDAIDNAIDVGGTADLILIASDWTQLPDNGLTDDCVALFIKNISCKYTHYPQDKSSGAYMARCSYRRME